MFFRDSFVIYKPKDIVAGDFYWWINEGNRFYLAAADCTGHGVPGAMISVACASILNKVIKGVGAFQTFRYTRQNHGVGSRCFFDK